MGVTGLWELASCCGKTVSMEELSNKRVAVDTSVWLVQFVRGMRTEDGGPVENAHLRGIFSRVCKMLFFGIKPVFVFDGGKPAIKQRTLAARAEARAKAERQEQVTARELLVARVKNRVLALVDGEGKRVSESELRSMMSRLDSAAREGEDEEGEGASFILPPFVPKLAPRPRNIEESARREALGLQLSEYEESASQLSVSEGGLLFSNLQLDNMIKSLSKTTSASGVSDFSDFSNFSGSVSVLTRSVRSDPGRSLVLRKGSSVAASFFSSPQIEKKEELLFVDVEMRGERGEEEEEFEEQSADNVLDSVAQKELEKRADTVFDMVAQQQQQQKQQPKKQWEWEEKQSRAEVLEQEKNSSESGAEVLEEGKSGAEVLERCGVCSWSGGAADESCEMCGAPRRREKKVDSGAEAEELAAFLEEEEEEEKKNKQCGEEEAEVFEEEEEDNKKGGAEVLKSVMMTARNTNWECEVCSWPNTQLTTLCEICGQERKKVANSNNSNILNNLKFSNVAIAESRSVNYVEEGQEKIIIREEEKNNSNVNNMDKNGTIAKMRREIEEREKELIRATNAQKRNAERVDDEMAQQCQNLLKLFGIPFILAPKEAESQCAELELNGLVDAVITEDSDIFLFGGNFVFKNMFRAANNLLQFESGELEKKIGFDRINFIRISFFLGSDYTVGVKGIGLVLALEILAEFAPKKKEKKDAKEKNNDLGEFDEEKKIADLLEPLIDFREWFAKENDLENSGRAKQLRNRLRNVELPELFPEPEVARAYLFPEVEKNNSQPFIWAAPKWNELKSFAVENLSWSAEKTESVISPICHRLRELEMTGVMMTHQSTISQFFASLPREISPKIDSVRLAKGIAKFTGQEFEEEKKKKKRGGKKTAEDEAEVSEAENEEKKKAGKKKKRKKIKRARSAYSFFMAEELKKRRKKNPEMRFSDVAKSCSVQWKMMEDRSEWNDRAERDRERKKREREELEEEEWEGEEMTGAEVIGAEVLELTGAEVIGAEVIERTTDVSVYGALSLSSLPPFETSALFFSPMSLLRSLAHRFGLQPSRKKKEVVAQLGMLTAAHLPREEKKKAKKMSARDKEDMLLNELDKIL